MARTQRAHPDQFVGLATLPLHNTPAALEVLALAVADGLKAVSMVASLDGRPIATDATLPLFERIAELHMPILLHPAGRSNTSGQNLGLLAELEVGWMYHTTLAALNLIESGTLDACPDLIVLHPHLGGVLPYVLGRLDRMRGMQRPIRDYLRQQFYVDTVGATPGALALAVETYGLDRVVFATDYPYVPVTSAFEYIAVNASPEASQAIFANVLPGVLNERSERAGTAHRPR